MSRRWKSAIILGTLAGGLVAGAIVAGIWYVTKSKEREE